MTGGLGESTDPRIVQRWRPSSGIFWNSQKWSFRARLFLAWGMGILGRQAACAFLSGSCLESFWKLEGSQVVASCRPT